MTDSSATPTELPRASVVNTRSLEHPPLGLVLVLAALFALPTSLGMLVQLALLGAGEWPLSILAVLVLQIAVHVLQLATGFAIIKRWHARGVFAVYLACALALVGAAALLWRDELAPRQLVALGIESLGGPLLVLVAPAILGVRHLVASRAVGGVLIAMALATWVAQPLALVAGLARFGGVSVGGALGILIHPAFALVTATLALLAGLRLASGRPARRLLRAYVIVAVAGIVVLDVASIIFVLVEDYGRLQFVIANALMTMVLGIAKPLVIWWYAKPELDGANVRVDAALPWVALWFVPYLLGRCLIYDELTAVLGTTLGALIVASCGAQAVANVVAAGTSLRDERSSLVWWLSAAALALSFLAIVCYVMLTKDRGFMGAQAPFMQLALLFGTAATAAWLRRRVTSAR